MEAAARLHGLRDALDLLENSSARAGSAVCRRLISENRTDTEALLSLDLRLACKGTLRSRPAANRVGAQGRGLLIRVATCPSLSRKRRAALIEPQYRACLKLTPDDLRLRFGLSDFLREHGDCEAAIARWSLLL